jgi:hypothetical protein
MTTAKGVTRDGDLSVFWVEWTGSQSGRREFTGRAERDMFALAVEHREQLGPRNFAIAQARIPDRHVRGQLGELAEHFLYLLTEGSLSQRAFAPPRGMDVPAWRTEMRRLGRYYKIRVRTGDKAWAALTLIDVRVRETPPAGLDENSVSEWRRDRQWEGDGRRRQVALELGVELATAAQWWDDDVVKVTGERNAQGLPPELFRFVNFGGDVSAALNPASVQTPEPPSRPSGLATGLAGRAGL